MDKLRIAGSLLLNTFAALIGPAMLESTVWHVFPSRSGLQVVLKTYLFSLILAGLLGVLAARTRFAKTATWAWLLPGILFLFGLIAYLSSGAGRMAAHFSGYDCAVGLQKSDCQGFLTFAVPLIRGVAYSSLAHVINRFWSVLQ